MANRYFYIYKITNLIDGKIYIGGHCTSNINDGYFGSGTRLINAIKKYGKKNFKKEILEWFENEDLMWDRERKLVNKEFLAREDVYNLVEGGRAGWTKSINTIKKLCEDPEYLKERCNNISNGVKQAISEGKGNTGHEHMSLMTKKSLSEEAILKRKQTYKQNKHQQGSNHNLYGKKILHKQNFGWIWVDRNKYDLLLSLGWKPGKGNMIRGTQWQ